MNQSAILKNTGFNPNKAQCPFKNVDIQYGLSVELVNTFNIKREHVANKHNNKVKKEHTPIVYKRKNFEDFIKPQGNNNFYLNKLLIQSFFRDKFSTTHMIVG